MITRRQMLAAALTATETVAAVAKPSRLSLEGYIWQNLAARAKKPLADMVDELFATAPYAGFQNIELNHGFFTAALREKVVALTREHGLKMPSVYVGGGMHEPALADRTTASAIEIGELCKQFGCTAVVNNPDTKPQNAPKTDDELATQARLLNRLGKTLAERGLELRVHHHTAEMASDAREFRHILRNTDPQYVTLCVDIEHADRGGMDPNVILREGGKRVTEIHLRNKVKTVPLEAFGPGDIDDAQIARTVGEIGVKPLVVVELAYHGDTVITREFRDSLKMSRAYAERVFGG
jgi:inosose dehydratase